MYGNEGGIKYEQKLRRQMSLEDGRDAHDGCAEGWDPLLNTTND